MDRVEVWAVVNDTTRTFVLESDRLVSLQIWDGGRFQATMVGCMHDGKPVTSVQVRQAEVVFTYMERRDG